MSMNLGVKKEIESRLLRCAHFVRMGRERGYPRKNEREKKGRFAFKRRGWERTAKSESVAGKGRGGEGIKRQQKQRASALNLLRMRPFALVPAHATFYNRF